MPVIKSAIKKLRRDRKIERENDAFREKMEQAIRTAKKTHGKKEVSLAFSIIDKAAKKNLIHKNKAARLKSNLALKDSKKTTPAPQKEVISKPVKTAPKAKISPKTKTTQKK